MASLKDERLKEIRAMMSDKLAAIDASFRELGDLRYNSTEGSTLLRDMSYYHAVLSRLEYEMACRLLPLD